MIFGNNLDSDHQIAGQKIKKKIQHAKGYGPEEILTKI